MNRFILMASVLATLLVISACGTAGKDFDQSQVEKIVNGSTTAAEVKHLLGPPFKKGLQNGKMVWLYEFNYYHSLGSDLSKDVFVTFDENNVVVNHQIMTSQPD